MATPLESGGEMTNVLGDAARVRVVVGGDEADLHERLPLMGSASGESSDGGPSHAGPVAADPPELQFRDAAMRQEIPVFAECLGLACQDGLPHVLRVPAGEGRVPGPDPLEVVAVGAADLREVKPAFVQPILFVLTSKQA